MLVISSPFLKAVCGFTKSADNSLLIIADSFSPPITTKTLVEDFVLNVTPPVQTLQAGVKTSFSITATAIGGFSRPITLAYSLSQPVDGITLNLSENPLTIGKETILTVETSFSTPPGSYEIFFSGVSLQTVRNAKAVITVNASNGQDFALTVGPASQTILQGATATFNLIVMGLNGFNQSVNLLSDIIPDNDKLTINFTSSSLLPDQSTTVKISTVTDTPALNYTIVLSANANGIVHKIPVVLTIQPLNTASGPISFNPSTLVLQRGQSIDIIATISRSNELQGAVTLSVDQLVLKPLKIKITPFTTPLTNDTSIKFTVTAKRKARIGSTTIVFNAQDEQGKNATAKLILTVNE